MRPVILKLTTAGLRAKFTGVSFCQIRYLRSKGVSSLLLHVQDVKTILNPYSRTGLLGVPAICVTERSKRNISVRCGKCRCCIMGTVVRDGTQMLSQCSCRPGTNSRFSSQCAGSESGDKGLVSTFEIDFQQEDRLKYSKDLQEDLQQAKVSDMTPIHKRVEERNLPEMSRTVYNLAPYVQKSETLQNLLKLGVNLSKVEKVKGIASLLVMSDFDVDILPYLRHLIRVGVEPNKLGYILTVNPLMLTQYIEHLEQRVGYLLSKDFSMADVASMYTRAPVMILMDPVKLDEKLGFLQQVFSLSAPEVRQVALTFPKILPWRIEKIADIRFNLKEFMGFEDEELKLMILKEPKLFTANIHRIKKTFDYVHNNMQIPHSHIVKWPAVLRSRLHIAKERHLFLIHLGRAQYDPYKENYVSLKSLIACKNDEFCDKVAKTTQAEFHSFLRTQ